MNGRQTKQGGDRPSPGSPSLIIASHRCVWFSEFSSGRRKHLLDAFWCGVRDVGVQSVIVRSVGGGWFLSVGKFPEAIDLHQSFISPMMSWLKNAKKSKFRQPSHQPVSLGIPAHIAAGPLGFGAELDLGIYPEGALRLVETQQQMGLIWLRW